MTANFVTELLETVEVTEAQEAGGLQVFGLRWANPGGLDYGTLDEGLADETLEVTEVGAEGSVPTLKVVNRSPRPVLLLAGEQLIGAKQNRVLNADILARAGGEVTIPVSCVEAGRWRWASSKFLGSGTMSHGKLRRMMSHQTAAAYKSMGTPRSDQGAVWGEVARKLESLGTDSDSSALMDCYAAHDTPVRRVSEDLRVPEGCHGVAFAYGGHIVGADLFDKPGTLARLWPKMVRSHALDLLEMIDQPKSGITREALVEWLRSARRAKAETYPSPGIGEDVRLEGEGVVGASLVVEERPIHLELFADQAG